MVKEAILPHAYTTNTDVYITFIFLRFLKKKKRGNKSEKKRRKTKENGWKGLKEKNYFYFAIYESSIFSVKYK